MNKIKRIFCRLELERKGRLAFVLIVQTAAWAIQKESLFMYVMITDKQSEPGGLEQKVKCCRSVFCNYQQCIICD